MSINNPNPASSVNHPTPERALATFITGFDLAQAPDDCRRIVRLMVKANAGTAFAGAAEDGIAAFRALLCEAGGAPQARTFVFGDRLPAQAAAQFNATLCRTLDFCDAMAPGPHFGAARFPAAIAAAELRHHCTGQQFMAALVVGAEVGARMNLSVDAQFSAAYCVANALVRRGSRLRDFTPASVADHAVRALLARIAVHADPVLDARGHTAVDLIVTTTDGRRLERSLDMAPGFPGADLSDEQHAAGFAECLAYAPRSPSTTQADRLIAAINGLEQLGRTHELVDLIELVDLMLA